jgi:hypothetical protein
VANNICPFVFHFCSHIVLNVFPFLLTRAESIVIGLLVRVGAANCLPHLSFFYFFMFATPVFSRFANHVGEMSNYAIQPISRSSA